jgi:uncharacterized OB-fold protein
MAIKTKFEQIQLSVSAGDPFSEFREIEILDLKQSFHYRHSLGKVSKFFLALEQGKLLATRCELCNSVYMPPRAVCPNDLTPNHWLELSGLGTLESWTLCPAAVPYARTEEPYILAYVRLEGTSSLFLQQLRNVDVTNLTYGLKVKAVFAEHAENHPLELFWFEPLC